MRASCLDRNGAVEVTLPQAVIDDSRRLKKLSINGGVQSSNAYKNCKSNTSDAQGNTYYRYTNGITTVSHRRYNSDSDYAYTVALNGLVLETIENGVSNGSFATLHNGGILKVTYNNYDSVSGSASIEGANGTSATIFRQSATKFSATITPKNGVAVSFSFAAKI